jgi:hypothetical protein
MATFQKFLALFAIVALTASFAGTAPVPGGRSYNITVAKPSVVSGAQLRPGNYRLTVAPDKITISQGKFVVNIKATIETAGQTYPDTALVYSEANGQPVLTEIHIGGTKTKLLLQ